LKLCIHFGAWLIDLFNNLKRENGVGYFVGLAVPDEFDFTLVLKKEKALFIG